ncbi:MAG: hypothetical protein GY885_03340, partial [Phycisphaeraceae bacterium]|nr:hypothetical protein [Phycisphaeraceae bacterium]
MKRPPSLPRSTPLSALMAVLSMLSIATAAFAAPPAPTDVVAKDLPADGGGSALVTWKIPADVEGLEGFQVWRTESVSESDSRGANERAASLESIRSAAYENEYRRLVDVEGIAPEDAAIQARAVAREAIVGNQGDVTPAETGPHGRFWVLVDTVSPDDDSLLVGQLSVSDEYQFIVYTVVKNADGSVEKSVASAATGMVLP